MKLGIGDDAAAVVTATDAIVSCDMLVEGTHFDANADPYYLGRKSLAVNLSDMAAMGAVPRYFLLALALPKHLAGAIWITRFAEGLFAQASEHKVVLVGGDLAHASQTTIAITVIGEAGERLLLRRTAKEGDDLWLSGSVGAAGYELAKNAKPGVRSRLHNPTPRLKLGQELVGIATAAIDLSDGFLLGALQLAQASNCKLKIDGRAIPLARYYARNYQAMIEAACAGEDYELMFTAKRAAKEQIEALGRRLRLRLTRVGKVEKGRNGSIVFGAKKMQLQSLVKKSYQHFQADKTDSSPDLQVLAKEIARLALQKKAKLAVAESCTGGMLGATLTELSGSSRWFVGGVVSYSNALKQDLLGIDPKLIRSHGAVSSQVARKMALGALALQRATVGVAITGVAGPQGTEAKPPGLVYIAWASPLKVLVRKFRFQGERISVRKQAVAEALAGLKLLLIE